MALVGIERLDIVIVDDTSKVIGKLVGAAEIPLAGLYNPVLSALPSEGRWVVAVIRPEGPADEWENVATTENLENHLEALSRSREE